MRQASRYSSRVESRSGGVTAWRRERLLHAGFGEAVATALARDRSVDLHALLKLVDRGCPPPLAVRILAPLDKQRRPS